MEVLAMKRASVTVAKDLTDLNIWVRASRCAVSGRGFRKRKEPPRLGGNVEGSAGPWSSSVAPLEPPAHKSTNIRPYRIIVERWPSSVR